MKLGQFRPPQGATHRRKRRGLGESSGHGKTSGRGQKGQRSRSGSGLRPGFEGGQMPLARRIPKRGFHHVRPAPIQVVNVGELNRFAAGAVVDPAALEEKGLIGTKRHPVKILGDGDLNRTLKIKVHRFSESALQKITAAGGSAEVIQAPGHAKGTRQ